MRLEEVAHVDDVVAVLGCSDVEQIEACQLYLEVCDVTKQLTRRRCATTV